MTTTTTPVLAPMTGDDLTTATHIRDRLGWHKVVAVSRRSVTVETPWSWHDLIPIRDVIEAQFD